MDNDKFNPDLIKEKLKDYSEKDIVPLKKEWRKWIENKQFDMFLKLKGANIQVIYDILKPHKVLSIRPAKYNQERIIITLKHSSNYKIEVIIKFDQPSKGQIGIVTYIKEKIKRH